MESNTKRLATVKNTAQLYQNAITEAGLRWLIFNEERNHFSQCLRRIGRKILIDLDAFEQWVESQNKLQEVHHA